MPETLDAPLTEANADADTISGEEESANDAEGDAEAPGEDEGKDGDSPEE